MNIRPNPSPAMAPSSPVRLRARAHLAAVLAALALAWRGPGVLGVTQPEFDCAARRLAYDQAHALLANTSLAHGLQDVHDALQIAVACGVAYTPPAAAASVAAAAGAAAHARSPAGATLHVATTGSDTNGDGSSAKPFQTLVAARVRPTSAEREMGRVAQLAGCVCRPWLAGLLAACVRWQSQWRCAVPRWVRQADAVPSVAAPTGWFLLLSTLSSLLRLGCRGAGRGPRPQRPRPRPCGDDRGRGRWTLRAGRAPRPRPRGQWHDL